MNNRKTVLAWLILLITYGTVTQAQELSIGDRLPDATFAHVLRYPAPVVRLGDLRGKIVVLDLWRTTCSHAVSSLSHFDSLAALFPGELVTLAVTTEPEEEIAGYLRGNDLARQTRTPVIANDTVLAGRCFPFAYIPHVVLANSEGKIVAITDPEKITESIIRQVLRGETIHLPLKKEVTDFDYYAPLLAEGNGRNRDSLVFSSTLTHRLPGVFPLHGIDTIRGQVFYHAYNHTIPELYAQALGMPDFKPNRLTLRVADRSRYYTRGWMRDDAWQAKNLWCYNLLLPRTVEHAETYALADLDRFFRTRARLEKRLISCLLLTRIGKGDRWRSAGGRDGYFRDSAGVTLIRNITLYNVVQAWDGVSVVPIVNRTGLSNETVDLRIRGSVDTDLPLLRRSLKSYDLDLVPGQAEVEMLVIEERGR